MVLNALGHEYVVEFKVYSSDFKFKKGKKQVAYYAKNRGLKEAYYVVFVAKKHEQKKAIIQETEEEVKGIAVKTFLIWYDENKDF